MSESKGSLIAKSVSKHAGRAKEKLLQNLGKVDRTADEIFDEHLQNFTKQQNSANRLQKEFNNYIRCIRAMQGANQSLMEAIQELYEGGWIGHEMLYTQCQNVEMLWNDFSHKLADQVLIPLNTYQSQFPEMRKKIEKRGRKLVDYDSQRHSAQSMQMANANSKKKDDSKAVKAYDQLEEAKRTYEMINSELHDELPALYDSRVLFLVTNLQTYFAAEQIFHSETSKVFSELEAIVDRLATDSQRGSYASKKLPSKPIVNNNVNKLNSVDSSQVSVNELSASENENERFNKSSSEESEKSQNVAVTKAAEIVAPLQANKVTNGDENPAPTNKASERTSQITVNGNSKPLGNAVGELPSGVLYKVKATYKYTQEDIDELSFDVGEIINVIEYDDPEDQEEGWLMGMKENGEKGMFPANFTRPL